MPAPSRQHVRSFAGGEIAPELYGRLDLTKFQTGLGRCYNFWILAHGPAQNRHGLAYVAHTRDSSKRSIVVPFSYNTEQTFAIEFGDQYIRWITNGGTLLEAPQQVDGITAGSISTIFHANDHGYANGQWVFVNGFVDTGWKVLNGRFLRVNNITAHTFEVEDLSGASIDSSTFGGYTLPGAATVSRVYELLSPYLEADIPTLHFTQSEDVLTITHRNYAPRELRRLGATNWELKVISFVPTIGTPAAPMNSGANPASGVIAYKYKTTALQADTLEESLPSSEITLVNDLTVAANKNNIDPEPVSGAVRYNVYKLFNGLYGYIGQTDGGILVDNNIVPDVGRTPAVMNTPFDTSGSYPSAVGYYESRRVFAGTITKPQNYWLTRSATESNLSYSIPTRDDDTIQGRLKASEVNSIRHVVTTNEQLVFLTSGGAWRLSPSNSDILTPTSALPKQISGEGASEVQPVKTADEVVYIGENASRLFAVKYKWEADGLITDDLSLMAPHLFDNFTFQSLTYSRGNKMVWAVRSDGKLVGSTYLPRHEVNAIHQHETNGVFESVCSVKEGADYPVYAVIARTLNGRAVRTIERMSTVRPTTQADAFFVDCGLTYRGNPTTVIGGLWHLVGETVTILADGAVHTPQEVTTAGEITLEAPASVVHIGLPYVSELETLPLVLENAQAAGQASGKNIGEVWLRVRESGGIFVGQNFDKLTEMPARSSEPYDTPPRLKNGVVHLTLPNNDWDPDTRLCIRQVEPLPLTIASMTLLVAVGG